MLPPLAALNGPTSRANRACPSHDMSARDRLTGNLWAQTTSPSTLTIVAVEPDSTMMNPGAGAAELVPFCGATFAGVPLGAAPVLKVWSAPMQALVP